MREGREAEGEGEREAGRRRRKDWCNEHTMYITIGIHLYHTAI